MYSDDARASRDISLVMGSATCREQGRLYSSSRNSVSRLELDHGTATGGPECLDHLFQPSAIALHTAQLSDKDFLVIASDPGFDKRRTRDAFL